MRRHLTLVLAVTMVLGVAGAAFAATTVFVSGYDPENQTLVFGASDPESEDALYDCTVADGLYDYQADQTGLVTMLKVLGGSDVTFLPLSGVSAAVNYLQTGGECDLTGVDVTGPNGQVNHGQVVSSLVHALKEAGYRGAGCMLSQVAQTDWGKGDQQVTATTAPTTTVTTAATITGDVDLTTTEVTCGKHENNDGAEELSSSRGDGQGNGHGRPSWAGQGNRGKNR